MWILLALGCYVTEQPNVDDRDPAPPAPNVIVVKPPPESYWNGLAVRVEKRLVSSPQEMARIARQLQLAGEITSEDLAKLGNAFPGMLTDAKAFPNPTAAAATLRSIK